MNEHPLVFFVRTRWGIVGTSPSLSDMPSNNRMMRVFLSAPLPLLPQRKWGLRVGFPGGTSGKEFACQCRRHKRHGLNPWVGKIPWRRPWQPTPVLLPGESHGQRRLAGWNRTEQLTLSQHFTWDFTSIWKSKNWTSGLVW